MGKRSTYNARRAIRPQNRTMEIRQYLRFFDAGAIRKREDGTDGTLETSIFDIDPRKGTRVPGGDALETVYVPIELEPDYKKGQVTLIYEGRKK